MVEFSGEGRLGNAVDNIDEDLVEGLYFGDAIRFFLDAKRAGGRSDSSIHKYRTSTS